MRIGGNREAVNVKIRRRAFLRRIVEHDRIATGALGPDDAEAELVEDACPIKTR